MVQDYTCQLISSSPMLFWDEMRSWLWPLCWPRRICPEDRFSLGHIRKAILKLFAYSFPFSVHFFFQIILWLYNRTDNYFSQCTHSITFQIKQQLRLFAGKTLHTSMLFLLCISVVMTISEDTALESNSYVAENPQHLHKF